MKQNLVVFGSFAVDLMARAPYLPSPGETVKGGFFKMGPGGKGFNQAVAAHKAGAHVTMITKLGQDSFADIALDYMQEMRMDKTYILRSPDTPTGCALIFVEERSSQNRIIVVPGACETIAIDELAGVDDLLSKSGWLLTQMETNLDAMMHVIELAHAQGVNIILNPAPANPIPDELLAKISIITPNEVEAKMLTGIDANSHSNLMAAANYFHNKGVASAVITLGKRGAFVSHNGEQRLIPAPRVQAIDTTGAGDAFNGALAAALAEGMDIWRAVAFSNALAAIAVQRMGTTPAMPTRAEVEAFLTQQSHVS